MKPKPPKPPKSSLTATITDPASPANNNQVGILVTESGLAPGTNIDATYTCDGVPESGFLGPVDPNGQFSQTIAFGCDTNFADLVLTAQAAKGKKTVSASLPSFC